MKNSSNNPENNPFGPEVADEAPNAMETEYGLLGCILIQNDLIDALGFLVPEHFYVEEHARIFVAMLKLRADGCTFTPFTLQQHIDMGQGYTVKYLTGAITAGMVMMRPVQEAHAIVEMFNRREILRICRDQISAISSTSRSAGEIVNDLTDRFAKIATAGDLTKFKTDKQVGMDILKRLQNPRLREPCSTGLKKLDTAMEGGLFHGMNYAFFARKKFGKTALVATIGCNLNMAGRRNLIICAEMSAEEVQQRIFARLTQSYTSAFRNEFGKTAGFQQKIADAIEASKGCLIFQSAPGITFDELRRSVAQAKSLYGIEGFTLDSLQLVRGERRGQNKSDHYDEVAQWCADYARQRGMFSIVTGQINQTGNVRGGEGARLACDQAYELHAPDGDPSRSDRWLEMVETRYTPWMNIGSKESPGLLMNEHGQYFYEPNHQQGGEPPAQAPLDF